MYYIYHNCILFFDKKLTSSPGTESFYLFLIFSTQRFLKFFLTLFDMGMRAHPNFVVIAPMIMKFSTGIKLDVFYTMVTKQFVTSLLLPSSDVITCILADA